jgi:hypothetical protein
MAAAVDDLVRAGHTEAILWTLAGLDRSHEFYEAMGWRASGEVRDSGRQVALRRALPADGR